MIKERLLRHFRSKGFQRRLRYIYIPFVKQLLALPWRKIHNNWYEKWYEYQYTHGEAKAEERLNSKIELSDSSADLYSTSIEPLNQEDAVDQLKPYLIKHEDQNFGMCVSHTVKNIYRFAVKAIYDGYADFAEHDVYIDRQTRQNGIDAGMSSSRTLDRIIEKGIAIDGTVPDPAREEDLELTRSDYPDNLVAPFRIKLLKSRKYYNAIGDFDKVWAFIMKEYKERGVRPFQFSITAMRGWWTSDVPTATGKVYGGHSVVGITIPFYYQGKRAFFCFDSSYRSGLTWTVDTGVRIVTEDCWNGLGRAFRPVTFIDEVERALGWSGKTPIVIPSPIELVTQTAQRGDAGAHVTAIQKALMRLGYDIPAITRGTAAYGFYGKQTADAVLAFHLAHVNRFQSRDSRWDAQALRELLGNYFGNLSVQVINDLILERNG